MRITVGLQTIVLTSHIVEEFLDGHINQRDPDIPIDFDMWPMKEVGSLVNALAVYMYNH